MKTRDEILKINAVLLYVLKSFPKGVDYIKLFKIIYFSHQEHLVKYGLPLLPDTFVAQKYGPVPSFCYKAMRYAEGKEAIYSADLEIIKNSVDITLIDGHQNVSLKDGVSYDEDELSVSNMKLLDKWIAACQDAEAFELSSLSHDKAWEKAKEHSEMTGARVPMFSYDIAKAGGASESMLEIIRERQINHSYLS